MGPAARVGTLQRPAATGAQLAPLTGRARSLGAGAQLAPLTGRARSLGAGLVIERGSGGGEMLATLPGGDRISTDEREPELQQLCTNTN